MWTSSRQIVLMLFVLATIRSLPAAEARHMSEEIRSSINSVVIVPGSSPAEQAIGGTYQDATPGVYAGAAEGASLGRPSVGIGNVAVSVPIPILTLPGAILGGLSGHAKRELQEFRDALAEEIADASSRPLAHEKLARQLYQGLRKLPSPEAGLLAASTEVPESADAVLYARITNIEIDVDESDAILTTSANMTVERRSDGAKLYESTIHYQDRAALSDWTANERALFTDYANFALYWLGEELAAEAFGRVSSGVILQPASSGDVKAGKKNAWLAETRALMPELAWDSLAASPGVSAGWPPAGTDPAMGYDVEIFDSRRPIQSAQAVTGTSYRLAAPLEPCKTYRWSVRPVYSAGGRTRSGEWMRARNDKEETKAGAIAGRDAAESPAYLQDFATLTVHCRAK